MHTHMHIRTHMVQIMVMLALVSQVGDKKQTFILITVKTSDNLIFENSN